MNRRTKIVATLGPATDRGGCPDELVAAGVDVVRLNLSHGTLDEHRARIAAVRSAAERAGRVVAVLADLPGPKLRAGEMPSGGVDLAAGAVVGLTFGEGPSTASTISVDYPGLAQDLAAGERVVIGDGSIVMEVDAVTGETVECRVVAGGRVSGRPGVHLPGERLRMQTPTENDLVLARVVAAEVDFLAVSFVRSAGDVSALRAAVAQHPVRLVAKIETAAAVEALAAIADAADAVMVARGDLGIECPLEDVPHLQKRIVRHCVEAGIPVITATQMLESMIDAPEPTRAEVSDVANAVFDGTDAVMLSGETAIGADPANVVRTMSRIVERAEAGADYPGWGARLGRVLPRRPEASTDPVTMAMTHAAWQVQADLGLAAIAAVTRSGRTAQAIARYRPATPLLGLSPVPATVRHLALVWGVTPLAVEAARSTDDLVWTVVARAEVAGHVRSGDLLAVLAGAPDRPSHAATDLLRVVEVP